MPRRRWLHVWSHGRDVRSQRGTCSAPLSHNRWSICLSSRNDGIFRGCMPQPLHVENCSASNYTLPLSFQYTIILAIMIVIEIIAAILEIVYCSKVSQKSPWLRLQITIFVAKYFKECIKKYFDTKSDGILKNLMVIQGWVSSAPWLLHALVYLHYLPHLTIISFPCFQLKR